MIIKQLTDNDFDDIYPQISGNNIVWRTGLFFGYPPLRISFYNGNEIIQLTNNDFYDSSPQISGNNIVWFTHGGNDSEIFFYNGNEIVQLTNN